MRKALILVLITTLSMSMLAFLVGCGKDQNKEEAKKYMQAGDNYMDDVNLSREDLKLKQTEMASKAMTGDLSAFMGAAGEALQKELEEAVAATYKNLELADAEYAAIIELDDVQDYKDYANKMMEAIAVIGQWLQTAEKLLASLSELMATLPPGQMPDLSLLAEKMPEIEALTELGDEADALIKEAEQIKADKKLES